jgi:glycosyltransferase involved in cell wall biosynthesis
MKELESIMFTAPATDYKHISGVKVSGLGSTVPASFPNHKGSIDSWYEIIVVNDGSTDDTGKVLENLALSERNIREISYDLNMGKGYAIRKGILESRGDYVIFMDGDGDIDAGLLASYLHKLKDADIVIASKYHPESVVQVPKSRRFLSRCFNVFVKAVVSLKVSDTQVGLKAGRGEAFRRIFDSVLVKRYAFDVEMLAVAQLLRLEVVEMPVKIHLDARFKKKEIVRMFLDVLGIVYRLKFSKHYEKNVNAMHLARLK